jgi:hypothetical protein
MSNVIRLANANGSPAKRACGTCRHAPEGGIYFGAPCQATGHMIGEERDEKFNGPCGPDGQLWEPVPPPSPRRGVLTVMRDWLVGGW